ncbi:UDP-N-acetylglucosamine 4,6-dehydratase [Psychrobacter sp. Sarcosine-3u-12]|uniref:UDP-N-acetylglucosamine 4,6-dehydratase n=1 Tax=Psychrobacter sp. Sarcosine-3u-12 TaxID=2058325 RepID=UPI000C3427C9|nr:UDP-N-acetylglucosamine 4,6-dehydratase [Psychrobacter sp. Sarcosine-3u-12]PKG36062.1 UDP-N-acetylglucosamine 4,6-dehydratase [Psychrobacter sp. Sarcosine-3u-12]
MKNVLELIGRENRLFDQDIGNKEKQLTSIINESSFLIIGGAGSIGQAVTKEIFKRNPKKLYVVDISENNLVELVRDLRSSYGYIDGDFQTFALDISSTEYDAFIEADGKYDYVLNLSALKHVRSEKDPFTLMRMINVNIFNTEKTIKQSIRKGTKKYFCVSTDKAANPVNMMGASKRIMEMFLSKYSQQIDISTARFANVAFSDGSLLHSFEQRIKKNQPIVAPSDIRRYFVTPQESGELCLMSCIFGEKGDIFFPKLSEDLHLITFEDIAIKYLQSKSLTPYLCYSEEEAREYLSNNSQLENNTWPCLFTLSDTTGEKDFEEFYTDKEVLDFNAFNNLGIIKNTDNINATLNEKLDYFTSEINAMQSSLKWSKDEIIKLFFFMLPEFGHKETGKYLDGKM